VIECLVGEGEKTTCVNEHLLAECGETTSDVLCDDWRDGLEKLEQEDQNFIIAYAIH
jgi:triosephosphate isomerase